MLLWTFRSDTNDKFPRLANSGLIYIYSGTKKITFFAQLVVEISGHSIAPGISDSNGTAVSDGCPRVTGSLFSCSNFDLGKTVKVD
jgi:hypothetical protein